MKETARQTHYLYPPFILFSWIWAWVIFADALYIVPLVNLSGTLGSKIRFLLTYFFYFDPLKIVSLVTLILACIIIVHPKQKMLFYTASILFLLKQWQLTPTFSNHHIIIFFFSWALVLSYVYLAIKEKTLLVSSKQFFEITAPIGRFLLLTMYFFGCFHKLNSAYLDPSVSCAVALWQNSPLPEYLLTARWAHYCAIYGTFVIEGLCIILLLGSTRMRYYGVILGVSFHLFLGINSFQFYGCFSLLCVALHFLFLPDKTLIKFTLRKWKIKPHWLQQLLLVFLFIFLFCLLIMLSFLKISGHIQIINILFMIFCLMLLCFVAHYGYELSSRPKGIISSLWLLNGISILFFLNCISPYIGLKTGQSMAMFSNLTIEQGQSNHLIIRKPPYLFNYLNEYVTIIESNDHFLKDLASYHLLLQKIYFDHYLQSIPNKSVTFRFKGKIHTYQPIKEHLNEIEAYSWFEKRFVFSAEYDMRVPRACALYDQVIMKPYKPINEINKGYQK